MKSFVDDEVDVDWLKLSSPRPLFEPTSESDDDFTAFLSPRHQHKQATPLVQNAQDVPSKANNSEDIQLDCGTFQTWGDNPASSDSDGGDDFTAFLSPRHSNAPT